MSKQDLGEVFSTLGSILAVLSLLLVAYCGLPCWVAVAFVVIVLIVLDIVVRSHW